MAKSIFVWTLSSSLYSDRISLSLMFDVMQHTPTWGGAAVTVAPCERASADTWSHHVFFIIESHHHVIVRYCIRLSAPWKVLLNYWKFAWFLHVNVVNKPYLTRMNPGGNQRSHRGIHNYTFPLEGAAFLMWGWRHLYTISLDVIHFFTKFIVWQTRQYWTTLKNLDSSWFLP